ncbi:hypothetical protein OOK41_02775 [Micromonospora sp. NBC_01655]|nr:hypothetical protein [Micromonospora sp. NBC_01655]
MSSFGPPGSGSPDDPYARPPGDPTPPQWGPPPGGDAESPTTPLWNQPPGGGYPPPPAPGGGQAGGYPPPGPGAGQPGGYPPPGPYPPPPGHPPAAGQPPTVPSPGGYPPPGQPAGSFPPAGQPGPWGQPAPEYGPGPVGPPPKRGGRTVGLIIALVVVLLLCPCLGLAGWGIWKTADEGGDVTPTVTTSAAPTDGPSEEPTAAPTTAEPSPSDDEPEFTKGDCVVNDGTNANADLREVPCGPNTYEILLRIPGTSDGGRCKTLAPRSTANYVNDNPLDSLDYVLCLRKRTS